jgi:ribonuclease T1
MLLSRFRAALCAGLLALMAAASCFGFSSPGAGLAGVKVSDLPPEARATLAQIKAGGPFAYARDGIVFGNREALLPQKARGYYREYTVRTPGRRDRGARRIVSGRAGEHYYSDDHYRTFRRILE